ncbi:MAG: glycogen/starch/alpha-glucan phosphorylase, partial [Planctomycetales bacterium]
MTVSSHARSTTDKEQFKAAVLGHITHSLNTAPERTSPRELYRAIALSVRDRLTETRLDCRDQCSSQDRKQAYYISMEFLIGRSLVNNMVNLGLYDACREVCDDLGFELADIVEAEKDAALGNGGLGRLAACFLDSLATLGLPGFGYGINYEYGLFRQEIHNGEQIEKPDNWRMYDSPWLIERSRDAALVPLYGRIEHMRDREGGYNPMWLDWKVVLGVPADMLIVGYGGKTVNWLRLFSARASRAVDVNIFNEGDYLRACEHQVKSDTISKILYPSESMASGRELRLIQEYFLVACSIRDVIRRFEENHADYNLFPEKVAIQLNDTHPALTIAELMRIFIDETNLPWDKAWDITVRTCAYTNHTLLPEALERWPVPLMEKVLPRHLQLIYEINRRFLDRVEVRWPGDD